MFLNASTVSWDESLRSLRAILPSAKSLDVTAIDKAVRREGHERQWKTMSDWEDLDDIKIFHDAFGRGIINGRDRGILIPDLCFWKKLLPFLVSGNFLEQFVEAFLMQFGEAFFNGDTVLLFPEARTICLFHHEGAYLKHNCERK